jgi:hypothetical protein
VNYSLCRIVGVVEVNTTLVASAITTTCDIAIMLGEITRFVSFHFWGCGLYKSPLRVLTWNFSHGVVGLRHLLLLVLSIGAKILHITGVLALFVVSSTVHFW